MLTKTKNLLEEFSRFKQTEEKISVLEDIVRNSAIWNIERGKLKTEKTHHLQNNPSKINDTFKRKSLKNLGL